MNLKPVGALSLFGLAMGIATIFAIPPNVEPFFWLAIFVFCAVGIARRQPSRPFAHGLLTSIANSVWITAAHLIFFERYVAGHPRQASMMFNAPPAPRATILLPGPVIGLVSA